MGVVNMLGGIGVNVKKKLVLPVCQATSVVSRRRQATPPEKR